MGNERIPTMMYDDVASTSSAIARMNEGQWHRLTVYNSFVSVVNMCYVIFLGSRKRKAPSSPIPDDNSHSPLGILFAYFFCVFDVRTIGTVVVTSDPLLPVLQFS
jgi:hypothetical protein